MEKTVILESMYLPPIEYFCILSQFEKVNLEVHESYTKQSYRNRCRILGPNGIQSLSIPLEHGSKSMADACISYRLKWWKEHWRSLETAYNRSPYMLYYKDELQELYFSETKGLLDFNAGLLEFCLKKTGINIEIGQTSAFKSTYNYDSIVDLRGMIHPKKDWKAEGFYRAQHYYQQFDVVFEPNLSIIDLLMMCGPESGRIIKSSVGKVFHE